MASAKTIEISRSELEDFAASESVFIKDVRHLSSYSWIEKPHPQIAVPGLPPLWAPPMGPQKLAKDSGFVYIAQNAARHPESPIEPLFRSLLMAHPSFDFGSIDVVSDRNNIRKLLQFVNPGRDSHKLEAFTINVEATADFAILGRTEAATSEVIGPNEFRGYGHEFEKKYTTAELDGATGHHRILSYRFCGMNFIIRHETDGYIKGGVPGNTSSETEGLSDLLGNLSLSSNVGDPDIAFAGSALTASKKGHVVSTESTMEIKTRSIKRPLDFDEVAPQLWVSQTPKLVRAYHDRGRFLEPKVEDVSAKIQKWEADNQFDLRKLGGLIKKAVSVAKEFGGHATIRYHPVRAKLMICQNLDADKVLPEDLYIRLNEATDGKIKDKEEPEPVESEVPKPKNAIPTHLPFATIIQAGIDKEFRQIFRDMPTNVEDYCVLCESLKAANVDVLQGRQVRDLMSDLRSGKPDPYSDEYYRSTGSKNTGRDSAFRLVYIFLQDGTQDFNAAFNATVFVVSHFRLFGFKTRTMVRRVFNYKYEPSVKQRKQLDRWPADGGSQDGDETTESPDFDPYYWDSDFS